MTFSQKFLNLQYLFDIIREQSDQGLLWSGFMVSASMMKSSLKCTCIYAAVETQTTFSEQKEFVGWALILYELLMSAESSFAISFYELIHPE